MMKNIIIGLAGIAMTSLPVLAGQTYYWQGPSGTDKSGTWETAGNWTLNGETATSYPGELANDDHAYLTCDGTYKTYTVTLASDKTLAVVERTKTAEGGAALDFGICTINLNGHTITASQRIDCSIRTYQFQGGNPGHGTTLVFTNGTVSCSADVVTKANGDATAYATASGVGIGLPWKGWIDRIRGVLSFSGVTANFNKVYAQSSQGGVRIDGGATVTLSGSYEETGSSDKINGISLAVSGEGTTFTASYLYSAGMPFKTNVFENGAVVNLGYLSMAADQKKPQTEADVGSFFVVRSGATLNITSANSGKAIYCHQGQVRQQNVLVTGEGTKLNLTYSSSTKGLPSIGVGNVDNSPMCHTFKVCDGAVATGDANSGMFIGSNTGNNLLVVDDATLSLGYLMCGTTYWYSEGGVNKVGLASNNTVRISGRRAKLEFKGNDAYSNSQSGGNGAMNLNFNTSLEILVPQTGFDAAPIQVPNHRLCTKGSTISAYVGTPGCHLTVNAKDWVKKHKGEEQALISTGLDSTAAFTELTNNVVFADIADEALRPSFRIDKNGTATSLVMIAPPKMGLVILLK